MSITLSDIEQAQKRISSKILKTQLSHSRSCSEWLGAKTFLKFENEQLTGSFKVRGALNKMLCLTQAQIEEGVVASSAGNHAQGVALGAGVVGAKAHIVMPQQSPLVKVMATQKYGAEVILHGDVYDESYAYARKLESEKGYTFVHPFEDPHVIAGQGTIGLEILEEVPDVDSVIVAIGGGGLISGVATAIKSKNPNCRIYGAVPESFSGMKALFEGQSPNPTGVATIADGAAVKKPSATMFDHYISKYVDDVVAVSDDEIARAVVFLLERAKSMVEGSGALPLAAAAKMKGQWDLGSKCCVLLGGGNIDLNLLSKIIERGLSEAGRIARLSVITLDLPGSLSRLTDIIAATRANILEVEHDRLGHDLHLRETSIDFLLETRSKQHIQEIIAALEGADVHVRSRPL